LTDRGWTHALADDVRIAGQPSKPIRAVFAEPDQIATAVTAIDIDVRGISKDRHVPLRVVVASIGDTGAAKAVDYGLADDLLLRPVSAAQIVSFLEAAISGTKAKMSRAAAQMEPEQRSKRFLGLRVLAADDTAVNREVLAEALDRLGVKVTLATDGEEAVEAMREGTFDLVFMDCSMPALDGYAATREIRRLEAEQGRAPVPIVALTAHVAGATATSWREAGMSDYITKPFTLKTIAATLKRWIVPLEGKCEDATTAPGAGTFGEAAPETKTPILDHTVLDDLSVTGGPAGDLVERVIALYKSHAPQALEKLQEAVAKGEAERIADTAHALKSMCRNIGAGRLSEALHRMESEARDGSVNVARAEIEKLPHELSRVIEIIDALTVRKSEAQPIALRA
jgi:two-component system sensor histidine kinase BarA